MVLGHLLFILFSIHNYTLVLFIFENMCYYTTLMKLIIIATVWKRDLRD